MVRALLLLGSCAPVAAAAADWLELPFAQKLDMAVVREVSLSPPDRLLAAIERHGVDLWLVQGPATDRQPNPLLSGVPAASAELIRCAEFSEHYEGRVVARDVFDCGLPRDAILIRDTASTYTLLHEFIQSRLRPADPGSPARGLELRFATAFRQLVVYQRHLENDPLRLLDPLWRRDILAAQSAVAALLFRRIQVGHSQEAIVEKLLCCHIDERSPFFDELRRARGLRYGEMMIDNAIDLFNTLNDSIVFVREAVRDLRQQIGTGALQPGAGRRLTDEDVDAVEAGTLGSATALAPVRDELERLKRFYER